MKLKAALLLSALAMAQPAYPGGVPVIDATAIANSKAEFANAGLQFIVGNFTFAAPTNAPDAAEGKPFAADGSDLSRTDTGDFTLVVPGRGALDILGVFYSLEEATDVLSVKLISRVDSTRTLTFTIYDGETQATPTDPSDGSVLSVMLVVKSRQV